MTPGISTVEAAGAVPNVVGAPACFLAAGPIGLAEAGTASGTFMTYWPTGHLHDLRRSDGSGRRSNRVVVNDVEHGPEHVDAEVFPALLRDLAGEP